jgi:enoyl-CoA hydratase/carnithine racemase
MSAPSLLPSLRHLVLDDPARRNPITPQFVAELSQALDDGTDAVVISAAAGEVFCAGGDLRLGSGLRSLSDDLYKLYEEISTSSTVVVVAANGVAYGGGAQLVLAADVRFVGPRFRFRCSDLTTGLAAGMWALPADVGRGRALDLLLSGGTLDADEAKRWGLIERLVPEPIEEALAFASVVGRVPPTMRKRIKVGVAYSSLSPGSIEAEAASFQPPSSPEDRRSV